MKVKLLKEKKCNKCKYPLDGKYCWACGKWEWEK